MATPPVQDRPPAAAPRRASDRRKEGDPAPLPVQTPADRLLARWGWLLGTLLSLVLSGALGYVTHLNVSDLPVEVLLGLGGVWTLLFFGLLVVWIENPVSTMMSTQGRECSIYQLVDDARSEIMGEIHRKVRELPKLDDETLDEIDSLVQSAAVAKGLMRGLSRASRARRRLVVCLALTWPAIIVASIFAQFLANDLADAVEVFFWVGLVMYAVGLLILVGPVAAAARWASRVSDLEGENYSGVVHWIRDWGDEGRG
jgi:hypothetical protein